MPRTPLRQFLCDDEPSLLAVGDILGCDSDGRWQIVERLNAFPIFVLKNQLSGESVLAVARTDAQQKWFLREQRDPEARRRYQRQAKRRQRERHRVAA